MTSAPTPFVIPEDLPPGKSIIVVSDLHLGGGEDTGTSARFCRFLDRVAKLDANTLVDDMHVYPPAKVILLGDIFDLWDPRDQDRDNVYIDGIAPFLKLGGLGCDLVYVTGNHDEDIGDIRHALDRRSMGHSMPLLDNTRMSIYKRIYPHIDHCLEFGGIRYSFPHGQQFDLQQITNTISECMGKRFDPVDFIEDLSNLSFSKSIPRGGHIIIAAAIAALFYMNGDVTLQTSFPWAIPFITLIFWCLVLFVLLFLAGMFWAGDECGEKIDHGYVSLFLLGLSLVLADLICRNNPLTYPGLFYQAILLISLFFFCGISVPRLFVYLKRSLYSIFNPKEVGMEEIAYSDSRLVLLRSTRRVLRPDEVSAEADVIVFGHTHWVDFYWYTFIQALPQPERCRKYLDDKRIDHKKMQMKNPLRAGRSFRDRLHRIRESLIIGALDVLVSLFDGLVWVKKHLPKGKKSPTKTTPPPPPDGKKYLLVNTGGWDRVGPKIKKPTRWYDGIYNALAGAVSIILATIHSGIDRLIDWILNRKPVEIHRWKDLAKPIDTFAYIDNKGISLMEWVCDPDKPGGDTMHVLKHFDRDSIIRAREDLHNPGDAQVSRAPSS